MGLSKRSSEKYNEWLQKVTNKSLLNSLEKMSGDEDAIENAFFKDLEFGTGGMRGTLGVGTNCMNIYNIRKVTQGVALTMVARGQKSVAISYDSRIKSKEFAKATAQVFASNGIKAFISVELAPTPFLSFAVRALNCDMGVMITASHNPKQYNGYKLYDGTGCQVLDDDAFEIIENINNVDPFEVNVASYATYAKKGLVANMDTWLTDVYLDQVQKQSINEAKDLKIVYTPLNGTGYKLVPQNLYERGFTDISIVESQAFPSGSFSTCKYPNPEKKEALKEALKLAGEKEADIVLATDPDADRVGIAVRHNGEYVQFTGNEVGVLLTDYILGTKYLRWGLPQESTVVRTIVTTSLVDKIANKFGAKVQLCLTGFKFIGDIMNKLEAAGHPEQYVFGFEESCGYLAGSYCRDKDAVLACMLIAEMASVYLAEGRTLVDQINSIYAEYGKFEHKTISMAFAGASGNAKMKKLMQGLRDDSFTTLGGGNVVKIIDYMSQTEYDIPKADVMSYEMDNGLSVLIRPSGTEPLIKFYITASKSEEENKQLIDSVIAELNLLFS